MVNTENHPQMAELSLAKNPMAHVPIQSQPATPGVVGDEEKQGCRVCV